MVVTANPRSFKARLRHRIQTAGNGLCVGIDPPVAPSQPFFRQELDRLGGPQFLERFSNALIDAAAATAPAVKFQSAFFEAFGPEGVAVLQHAMARARGRGLLTILDAKRGDIASTMAAYGRMAFDVMQADALTVTPYMGFDVIEPLESWLAAGRGVYVVWVSSNPGGALVQELENRAGESLAQVLLAEFQRRFATAGLDEAYGLVLGATKLDTLAAPLRAAIDGLPLLMPGVGAQGATVTPSLRQLMQASGASLVPISRGLSDPTPAEGSIQDWGAYEAGLAARIGAAAVDLAL